MENVREDPKARGGGRSKTTEKFPRKEPIRSSLKEDEKFVNFTMSKRSRKLHLQKQEHASKGTKKHIIKFGTENILTTGKSQSVENVTSRSQGEGRGQVQNHREVSSERTDTKQPERRR